MGRPWGWLEWSGWIGRGIGRLMLTFMFKELTFSRQAQVHKNPYPSLDDGGDDV